MPDYDSDALKKTSMSMLLYGDAGVGKSVLADTAPGPRLVIDTESGSDDTASRKVKWNPMTNPMELGLGKDDTAVFRMDTQEEFKYLREIKAWLTAGKHPFRSVIIDSFMELQMKQIEDTAGGGSYQLKIQEWGDVLYKFVDLSHKLHYLSRRTDNQLSCVVIISGTQVNANTGRIEPYFKGQFRNKIPYIPDVMGYLHIAMGEDGTERRLGIDPDGVAQSKSRKSILPKTYGKYITEPNLTDIMRLINEDRKARLKALEEGEK